MTSGGAAAPAGSPIHSLASRHTGTTSTTNAGKAAKAVTKGDKKKKKGKRKESYAIYIYKVGEYCCFY